MDTYNTIRIDITVPEDVVREVKRITSKRGVSQFFTEAAREKLAREKREKALKEILAAPPAFTDIKDSVTWIRKSRRLDEKRMRRLGL
ncbi:hypothetical protein A2773_03490 [Candidatus Gottesmanbacteria bacterium RIFCSPHIGHO2_01_FULL_39_10]|uniref:Ribbon-helix-helix protein CopG domain-containing protein n=1 Tax=Candidatus Gottesmanbacteria bacterium RIFCSPHIGHO2_01_FULL_39_10 TaxID=1798375 RepID=A0A1F5ZPR5_9BACT|nr:MAG: hypothetical protein A2773_03490 [Candidatus Gottesmanbacteria bacterium RIFCSPHIGHO2_01_FULL_39_10]